MKLYQIQRQAGIGVLGTERDVRELFPEPAAQAALDLFFEYARPGDVFDGLYRDDLDERGEPLMYVDGTVFVVALGRRFTPRLQVLPICEECASAHADGTPCYGFSGPIGK